MAERLQAQIVLLATQVVPLRLPLDRPQVSVRFLQQQLLGLVSESGVHDTEVVVQVALCRDRDEALKSLLPLHSLIVIGQGRQLWLRPDRKLVRFLRRLGHEVISVDAGFGMDAGIRPFVRQALAHLRLPGEAAYFNYVDLGGNEK
jgi:hypothetical protein